MSIQLSLFWHSADQVEWYWSGDDNVYQGAIEELQDQKQQRNLDECPTRLFLPGGWFSTVDVYLPVKSNRVNKQMVKFAVEEYLAQDIDTVHLVVLNRKGGGEVTLLVTDLERFSQLLKTLNNSGFRVVEAFNVEQFILPESQTEDVVLLIQNSNITLSARDQIFNVHAQGFAQWFDIWAEQNALPENATIRIVSEQADSESKGLVTQFEAAGQTVQWVVEDIPGVEVWHERAQQKKPMGNLITSEFSQRGSAVPWYTWLPATAAGVFALCVWLLVAGLENGRLSQQIDQTWAASENVFLQVFGQSKRIQRPLMVREMRSQAVAGVGGGNDAQFNALTLLSDLSISAPSMLLEDLRFNAERNEAYFTLVQPAAAGTDAYSLFETLKTGLTAKGYTVEYSAKQETDNFKAQFKAQQGGQG